MNIYILPFQHVRKQTTSFTDRQYWDVVIPPLSHWHQILWLLHLSLVNQTYIKCVLLLLKLKGGKSTKWNCDYGDFSNLRAVNCAGESRGEINSYVKPLTEFSSIYFNKRLKCFHKNMKKIIDRSATLLQVH